MKIRRSLRLLHRDLGYFFFGMTIIYAISGLAINHRHHWNPNYIITQQEVQFSLPEEIGVPDRDLALYFLRQVNEEEAYRNHVTAGEQLRIFIRGGRVRVDLTDGSGHLETNRRRPVLYHMNYLHYNAPKRLWTYFADLFALGLIVLAVTGLYMVKGKKGVGGRGAWFLAAGILIPLLFLFFYLFT